jgi:hypothetical protein
MDNLIYFSVPLLTSFDGQLKNKQYRYHHWFEMIDILEWPAHITSRISALNTPWPLASSVCTMPQITSNELNFSKVIEYIADEFCKQINQSNQTPYVYWSGGIDSTSILVSLLKVANSEFLKKLVVVCDQSSIKENSYFYYKFIDKKIQIQPLETFSITADNYKQIIIVDGEAGNQCLGWRAINVLAYYQEFDLLAQPWQNIKDFNSILPGCTEFARQMICDSIGQAPINIDSVYDFLWWTNFNFKFDDVLLRKAHYYTKNLSPEQSKYFWNHSINRFYAHPLMQQWSMLSKDLRREKTQTMGKYFAKKYIYEFDCNELWYVNKKEESSDSRIFYESRSLLDSTAVFAIDQDWNRYSLADLHTRQELGRILQRI